MFEFTVHNYIPLSECKVIQPHCNARKTGSQQVAGTENVFEFVQGDRKPLLQLPFLRIIYFMANELQKGK